MTLKTMVVVVTAALMSACVSQGAPHYHYVIDSELRSSLSDIEFTLSEPREPIAFDGGSMADNCKDYLAYRQGETLVETVTNQLVKSEYLVCEALDVIVRSPAYKHEINTLGMGESLLTKLDLRGFPNAFSQVADDTQYTLAELFPEAVHANKNNATLSTEDWVLSLRVVAVIDINNNGDQDWLVQIADEAKVGSYRYYGTFVIVDPLVKHAYTASDILLK